MTAAAAARAGRRQRPGMTLPAGVPGWPPLAGVVALVGAVLVGTAATVVAALAGAAAGADGATPAIVLGVAALGGGGTVAVVLWLAARTRPPRPAQLGLRPISRRAALLTAGGAMLLAGTLAGLGLAPGVPPELDPRSAFARDFDLPLREAVGVGPGLAASALARCVIPVVVGELLLRGFALPALWRWRGPLPAVLIVAVLFGGATDVFADAALVLPAILLGVVLCWTYLTTGSLVPGIALSAAASGAALGVGCALSPAGALALAAACVVVAVGLVTPFLRAP